MDITKKLIMSFKTTNDKKVSISVDSPREDLTEEEIVNTMNLIITEDIFTPGGENLISLSGAKIVQTDTSEYDLVL